MTLYVWTHSWYFYSEYSVDLSPFITILLQRKRMIHTSELSVYFAYWVVIMLIFIELSLSRFPLTTEIRVFQRDRETEQRLTLKCHKHSVLLSTWWNSLIAIYTFGVYQSFYTAQHLRTHYHGINNQGNYRRRYFATNTTVDRLGFFTQCKKHKLQDMQTIYGPNAALG